jgi:hypothetical protein
MSRFFNLSLSTFFFSVEYVSTSSGAGSMDYSLCSTAQRRDIGLPPEISYFEFDHSRRRDRFLFVDYHCNTAILGQAQKP